MTSTKIISLTVPNVDISDITNRAPSFDGTATPVEDADPDFCITLPKAVFELYRFASKEDHRPTMACIELRQIGEQGDGLFMATATDGHRAITITFRADQDDNFGLFPSAVLLPAHLLKATKPKNKDGVGTVSASGDAMRIQTGDLVGECTLDTDASFPNVQQVIPPQGATDGVACKLAGFNLAYLADVAAVVKACGAAQTAPAISWPADATEPLRADCDLGNCVMVYVQMPVRL